MATAVLGTLHEVSSSSSIAWLHQITRLSKHVTTVPITLILTLCGHPSSLAAHLGTRYWACSACGNQHGTNLSRATESTSFDAGPHITIPCCQIEGPGLLGNLLQHTMHHSAVGLPSCWHHQSTPVLMSKHAAPTQHQHQH